MSTSPALTMDPTARPTPPPLPSFPTRLSSQAPIWEAIVNEDEEDEDLEFDENGEPVLEDDEEFMNEEFKADLAKLEDHWYKQAARLTTYLVSPIHDAAAKGNLGGLEEFITNQGQDVDTRDHAENTPLHYAAGAGHVNAVIWLLDHGAKINALNLLGDTALHRAVWRRHLEVVKVLCARGIDRSVINKQGHSAIDLVRDVDIGAEIQSYDPVDDDDLDDRYDYVDEGGEDDE